MQSGRPGEAERAEGGEGAGLNRKWAGPTGRKQPKQIGSENNKELW